MNYNSLKEISRFIKDKKNQGHNIAILKGNNTSDDAVLSDMPKRLERKRAKIVEGANNKISFKFVQISSEFSHFRYFLDGIERKRVLFNYNFLPVTYGYVSAVIMKRIDKKMCSADFEISRDRLYLPYKEFNDSPAHYFDIKDFEKYKFKIKIENTGLKDKETQMYPLFPAEFERKAHNDIQSARVKLEKELVLKWVKSGVNDGWLFVDGRLESINKDIENTANIAGIIKSHNVVFFDPEDQYKIYAMKKGERTSVFQPIDIDRKENVYTWYLRLHESSYNGKIDFGIIRVEIPANDEFLDKVDEISSWILLETRPVAFPEARWDRMIYPIKYCEDYLKSKAPSWAVIESL